MSEVTDIDMINILLTKQERLCLYWSAHGKTSEEIANLLEIKKCTVDGYKKQILKKFEASNTCHAIFKAINYGYLPVINKLKKSCFCDGDAI